MTAIPPRARRAVEARSRGVCEMPDCLDWAVHMHHRKMRSQGGPHSVENLLHLCDRHHIYIHNHPAESYEKGWLVRSWDEAS